jgi:hypothetical protein
MTRKNGNELESSELGPEQPRFVADLTGDGPADIVAFGDAGHSSREFTLFSFPPAPGVCLGVSFFLQSAALMSGNSGTDARFPSRVRQNVVVG